MIFRGVLRFRLQKWYSKSTWSAWTSSSVLPLELTVRWSASCEGRNVKTNIPGLLTKSMLKQLLTNNLVDQDIILSSKSVSSATVSVMVSILWRKKCKNEEQLRDTILFLGSIPDHFLSLALGWGKGGRPKCALLGRVVTCTRIGKACTSIGN